MKNICLLLFLFFSISVVNSQNKSSTKVKVYHYKDQVVSMKKWYNNNRELDSVKTYYKSGKLDESFYYKKGSYHDKSYKFNPSGEKLTTWKFNNGKLISRTDHKIEFNKKTEEKVKKYHAKLIELNEELKEKPQSLRLKYQIAKIRNFLGNNILALNDFKKIEKIFSKITKTKKIPEKILADVYFQLAIAYQRYEQENPTIHYKFKAIKTAPKESRHYYNFGSYLISIKLYRLGIQYLNKAIDMVPNHSFANWGLAAAYTDLEDSEKAMTCVNIAFKNEATLYKRGVGSSERNLQTIRGLLHHKLGDSESGITDLEEALKLNNSNTFALRNLGVIYHDLGNYNKSCKLLQKAHDLGYEKTHDRYDLKDYLEFSCNNKTSEKKWVSLSELPYVYPNPSVNEININNFNFENFDYQIYNFESKLIQTNKALNKTIDISNLPTGLYILKVPTPEKNYTFKIVKN